MKRLFALLFISLSFYTLQAQTIFQVTNTNDSGPGSLRQAILDGNALNSSWVINLNGPTFDLTIGLQTPLPILNTYFIKITANTSNFNSLTISAQTPSVAVSNGICQANNNGATTITYIALYSGSGSAGIKTII